MRELIKSLFRSAGLSVRQLRQDGRHTLLGLRRRPIGVIVDVGANEGQFAAAMLDIFPAARLWCVEPLPGPYAALAKWAAATGGRVQPINCALGESAGTVTMHLHVDHPTSSSLLGASERSGELYPQTRHQADVQVPLKRLDDLRLWEQWEGVPGERLLKLDVQGYEDRVLAGAPDTLARVDHVILEACLEPLYDGQATFEGLVARLAAAGFGYRGNIEQAVGADDRVVYIDALFSRAPGA